MGKQQIDLNGKTILVTGSPGFIGANLVLRLLRELRSGTVVSFDNSHYCLLSPVSITSLTHEKHQPGRAAAEALLNLINEKSARSARLSWTLRERASG